MLTYYGSNALSSFRAKKLLEQLQSIDPTVSSVSAQYVHFVDAVNLNEQDNTVITNLLEYGSPFAGSNQSALFLVIPRSGTISPWSSKATDIVKNSGIGSVARVERGVAYYVDAPNELDRALVADILHDRMTEQVLSDLNDATLVFQDDAPREVQTIDVLSGGKPVFQAANTTLGLALTNDEIDYLLQAYSDMERNPTDVELMMFAQVNSEHCRHKIFNADWIINGEPQPKSLFKMIKNTHELHPNEVLTAYSDNAAVLNGVTAGRFVADPHTGIYGYHDEPIHTVIKVETHNHPTAIAPGPGAATGTGGEIRDEAATGRGAKSKAGLVGFSVSNLAVPGAVRPWERAYGKPERIASALDIMLEAPIGGAAYANEFGRPNLCGYFRTYEQIANKQVWGYHKPIMIAGGMGNIKAEHVAKLPLPVGTSIIVLGGPSMLIGLGGGAASSKQTGSGNVELDYASVQRANAEMERRAQQVIDHCWSQGADNPILSIHDVGAGGLSNALPELVHDAGRGANFELRNILRAEAGLSPLEIWCNESQERYVLGLAPESVATFEVVCKRERCPFSFVGTVNDTDMLVVHDALFENNPVELPMSVLFGKPPKMTREVTRSDASFSPFDTAGIDLNEAIERVLQLPAVGSKQFLITIGDRTVGGLVTRDQMVGPWQVPVADAAVTAVAFDTQAGEVMAMGERTPIAVLNAPASARIAIGEVITNALCADVAQLSDLKLSANWMAAAGYASEDQHLYETVLAVGEDFCPALGITIPVGKDSLSMRTTWTEDSESKSVTSPLSLIVTAFGPVSDVHRTLTPQLDMTDDTVLILLDLGNGKQRLGGSALAQVYNQTGDSTPDVEPQTLIDFFELIQKLKSDGIALAYHDRSDGGLLATVLEMAFASRCGLQLDLSNMDGSVLEKLFNEELGVVIQVPSSKQAQVLNLVQTNLDGRGYIIGKPTINQTIAITDAEAVVYSSDRASLQALWSDTSYQLQKLRDNPDCADQELQAVHDDKDPGLSPTVTFELGASQYSDRPKIAIFREQGVNGQTEMAAAFDRAGFTAVDVHLNDIVNETVSLNDFVGLAACGGFSYGDVLGAGEGWAKSILANADLRAMFKQFFERSNTFTLGVCNGCQMLSALKELIPGAAPWPKFSKNNSEQFEARLVLTQITESPSIFFKGMAGSYLPIPTAHGEGRAEFASDEHVRNAITNNLVAMQYVDNYHHVTEAYPSNPGGSALGITALTTPDGRATILMPHPERAFMTRQLSWHPENWTDESSPIFRMFQNARDWVDES